MRNTNTKNDHTQDILSLHLDINTYLLLQNLNKHMETFDFDDESCIFIKRNVSSLISSHSILCYYWIILTSGQMVQPTVQTKQYFEELYTVFNAMFEDIYSKFSKSLVEPYGIVSLIHDIEKHTQIKIPLTLCFVSRLKKFEGYELLFELTNFDTEVNSLQKQFIKDLFSMIQNKLICNLESDENYFFVINVCKNKKLNCRTVELVNYCLTTQTINYLTYHYCGQNLGLMYLMTDFSKEIPFKNSKMLIDFELQQKINSQIACFFQLLYSHKPKFDITQWFDNCNHELLSIHEINGTFVDNQGYFNVLIDCLTYSNATYDFFSNYEHSLKWLYDKIELMEDPNYWESSHWTNIYDGKTIGMGYTININDVQMCTEKIIHLKQIVKCTQTIEHDIYCIRTHMKNHYRMLGQMLNVIVDCVLGKDSSIYDYCYDVKGAFNDYTYCFNVCIGRLYVEIDGEMYHIYFGEFTVSKKILIDGEIFIRDVSDVDNGYKCILKIVMAEQDFLTNAGISNGYINSNMLCCPILSHPENVFGKGQNIRDKYLLDDDHYFVGGYINGIFDKDCFTKYYDV